MILFYDLARAPVEDTQLVGDSEGSHVASQGWCEEHRGHLTMVLSPTQGGNRQWSMGGDMAATPMLGNLQESALRSVLCKPLSLLVP